MKKWTAILITLLLAALCAFAAADKVAISKENFPDDIFRNYVSENFDTDSPKDGYLSDEEIAAAKSVSVTKQGITTLNGIEFLSCLESLSCDENQIAALDLSKNSTLVSISCNRNSMTSLNLRYLKMLTQLQCHQNKLTSLDVSESLYLSYFDCDDNELTGLDVSRLKSLQHLYCGRNKIGALDLSNCTQLVELIVCGDPISSLDVSKNTALTAIQADGCKKLKALDLSANTRLQWLWCANTAITKLNISKCRPLNAFVISNDPVISANYLEWGSNDRLGRGLWIDRATELTTSDGVYAVPDPNVQVSSIKLNKTKLTLTRTSKKPKPSFQLKATVSPANAGNKAVTWKSSNTRVAKVDQTGKVIALRPGTATITCTAKDGSRVKATCKVTVKDTKVSKITLSKTKATLRKGRSLQLKVKKITPATAVNKNVKWSTSDKKVATVDKDGKVKAVGKGTCIITCTAADGSKVKATCKITVK